MDHSRRCGGASAPSPAPLPPPPLRGRLARSALLLPPPRGVRGERSSLSGSTAGGGRSGGEGSLFSLPPCGGGSGWGVHESQPLKNPQTPSRRNARPGVAAASPEPFTPGKAIRRAKQDRPTHRLPSIRSRVRPRASLNRRHAGTSRWVGGRRGRLEYLATAGFINSH